jgi:hypothetical protein
MGYSKTKLARMFCHTKYTLPSTGERVKKWVFFIGVFMGEAVLGCASLYRQISNRGIAD